ncbi:major allergen I polypeptide chain 1-like [Heterocephalus glaber]|uniref:Major allergen I polypeptide chain 1-like n=1 Tax=Heterocephalus glaber TaxID=10181 RepID=A0AAX6RC39_HETGA|nr:major allergen I polypeptide chain 1-like [Heterocephalus glaber]
MKPATALVLLGAALLLIPGRNGELCSAVKKDVDLFLNGTTDEYVTYMKKYISDPEMLAIAASVKECVDDKLTEEDKENASSVLVSPQGMSVYLCLSGDLLILGVRDQNWGDSFSFPHGPAWKSGRKRTS